MVRLRWSHQTNVTTSWPSVPSAHGLGLILRRLWINVQVRTGMEFKIMKLSTLNDLLLLFCNPLSVSPFCFPPLLLLTAGEKQVILVVLHHTFDSERSVTNRARENSPNLLLSVDLLFYEEKMLRCAHNKREFNKILEVVGHSPSTVFKQYPDMP